MTVEVWAPAEVVEAGTRAAVQKVARAKVPAVAEAAEKDEQDEDSHTR